MHWLIIRVQNHGGRNVRYLWYKYRSCGAQTKFWPEDLSGAGHVRQFLTVVKYWIRSEIYVLEDVTWIDLSHNRASDWTVSIGERFCFRWNSDRMLT